MKAVWFVLGTLVALAAGFAFGQEEVETQDLLASHGLKVLRTFKGQEVVAPVEVPSWTQFVGPVGAVVVNGGELTGILFFSPDDPSFLFTELYDSEFHLMVIVWGLPGEVRVAIDLNIGGEVSGVLGIATPAPEPEAPKVSPATLHWSI